MFFQWIIISFSGKRDICSYRCISMQYHEHILYLASTVPHILLKQSEIRNINIINITWFANIATWTFIKYIYSQYNEKEWTEKKNKKWNSSSIKIIANTKGRLHGQKISWILKWLAYLINIESRENKILILEMTFLVFGELPLWYMTRFCISI